MHNTTGSNKHTARIINLDFLETFCFFMFWQMSSRDETNTSGRHLPCRTSRAPGSRVIPGELPGEWRAAGRRVWWVEGLRVARSRVVSPPRWEPTHRTGERNSEIRDPGLVEVPPGETRSRVGKFERERKRERGLAGWAAMCSSGMRALLGLLFAAGVLEHCGAATRRDGNVSTKLHLITYNL